MCAAYIPPHLRAQGVQPHMAQNSATEALANEKQSHFQANRGSRRTANRGMARSFSVPARLSEISDQQVEELFAQNEASEDFQVYEDSEVKVHSTNQLDPITQFPRCGVDNQILSNIAGLGYKFPTAVQKYSIPYILNGHDLIVTSQTGSGKTAAFMLPVITQLLKMQLYIHPSVVIMCPTRELALQIEDQINKFAEGTGLQTVCVFGGSPIHLQLRQLSYACNILVATPGRLNDILKRGQLQLKYVKYLILDEADRMLDMGFEPQISEVINGFDMTEIANRQTLLFSATFPSEVQNLARSFMKSAFTRIEVGLQDPPALIEQHFEYVRDYDKFPALIDFLNAHDCPTLVFAERKTSVDRIEDYLYEENYPVVAIHGDRDMDNRLAALDGFTSGRARIMVATDVAARGIDIPNVGHVINMDLPTDVDSYIHRIGRTGRAGRRGVATSFWNESNEPFLIALLAHLRKTQQPIPDGLEEFAQHIQSQRRGGSRGGRGGGRRGMPRDRSFNNIGHRY